MGFIVEGMQLKHAIEIASWKYDPPYDFYNSDDSVESIEELLNGDYYVVFEVYDKSKIIGFYCFKNSAIVPSGVNDGIYNEDRLDIGLGMHPELCSKGQGSRFVKNCLVFASHKFKTKSFRLTVAIFNKRAIKVYKGLGFNESMSFERENSNGLITNFKTMIKDLC